MSLTAIQLILRCTTTDSERSSYDISAVSDPVSDIGKPAVRLLTAELTENLGELATDLIESAVELDVQRVDFLIDTLDQLVERVDVGTLLAHLTLDLGLGHCGNHSGGGLRWRYASLAP